MEQTSAGSALMTIKAHYDGRVFVPDSPVDLPVGHPVVIELSGNGASQVTGQQSSLARLADLATRYPENADLPEDFSTQHDHYLYGTPKRSDP